MSDALSLADLLDVGIDHILGTPGTRFIEAQLRREGSDLDLALGASAAMGEEVAGQAADVARDLLLDTAEGEALDRVVFDLPFPVERQPAAPALVTLRFARASAAAGAGTIDAQTRVALDGVTFRTRTSASLSTSGLTVDVVAAAEQTGPGGNVDASATGTIQSVLWDTTLTVVNPAAAAGGQDRESDDSLRARARAAQQAARRGIRAAIEAGALTVPQVTHATAFEELDADGVPTGWVTLVISDDEGNSNTAIAALVETVLEEYRGAGVPVTVAVGVVRLEDIVIAATYVTGQDTLARFDEGAGRVVAYVNALAPGEVMDPGRIAEAFMGYGAGVYQTGIKGCKVVEPSGPVVPETTDVIRTSRALITQGTY